MFSCFQTIFNKPAWSSTYAKDLCKGILQCFLRIPNLFFQAEDGIRDLTVTGVQTCALPILLIRQYLAGYSESQPTTAVTLHRTSYFGSAGDFWLEALAAALLMIVSLVLLVACAKDRKSVV